MKHFSEEAWADLVRDVAAPAMKTMMQQHINDGCSKCGTALQVWQTVLSMARSEDVFTPPDDAVRVSKSQFRLLFLQRNTGFVFYSIPILQPITAGVRGAVSARQFLYETDDYYHRSPSGTAPGLGFRVRSRASLEPDRQRTGSSRSTRPVARREHRRWPRL